MALNMTPQLWAALCAAAAQHPTCTLRLRQHQGWIKSFTVEHGPEHSDDLSVVPPRHVQPTVLTASAPTKKRS